MLRMITGAAWASPSKTAVSEMVSRATALRDERFIIIVPEQYTLQTQKTAVSLHPDHACMNIDVVSFDRVAHVVLSKLGKDINEVLDDTGKALILRSVLEECSEDLAVYRSKIHMPGFIEELKSLITEFRQYRVDDNMLYLMQEDAALKGGLLYYKLQDIRLIYRRFNEKVEEDYATSEEILDIFERLMLQSDFLKDTHIYLDGFTGFTPVQLRIIRNMLTQAKDVTCAVTVPEDRIRTDCPEYDLFYLANETIFKLCRIAEEEACGIEHISADRNISLSDADSLKNIHIVSCRSSRDEAAYAARQILKLVRKEGRRFSDIAVMTADMESYYSILKSTFEDAGIPAFIDHKEEFSGNMLVRFIISALEVASKGMLYEQMFAFLKSGLSMIDYDECALLENYCLEFNIRGRGRWESGFTANRELKGGEYAWDLDRINDIRSRACTGIAAFYGTASGGRHKAVLFTKALRKLMNELDVRSRIEALSLRFEEEGNLTAALQYSQICDKAEELLDKIDLILGSRELDVKEFEDIVLSGIEEIRIGTIPPSMDAVIAGDLTRTRLGDISYLFILGMNEGRVPSAGSGSVLFTQRERTSLRKDYEIAPTVQENINSE